MTWQRVDPRYLRQEDPSGTAVEYCDPGPPERGELRLWVAPDGDVTGFLLAHAELAGGREYLADWRRGHDLRVAEVDAGEGPTEHGPRPKMSPLVHYHRWPPSGVVAELLGYFRRNAAALEPRQREQIAAILAEAMQASIERESSTREEE